MRPVVIVARRRPRTRRSGRGRGSGGTGSNEVERESTESDDRHCELKSLENGVAALGETNWSNSVEIVNNGSSVSDSKDPKSNILDDPLFHFGWSTTISDLELVGSECIYHLMRIETQAFASIRSLYCFGTISWRRRRRRCTCWGWWWAAAR